ncbi:MAG: response regulator [Desulfobacterales bacterium]|nr:response regulator [Desulfobacterales bacterium]
MAELNGQDMIDELIYDIKRKDARKARVVLSYFDKTDDKTRKRMLFELSRTDVEFSIPLLANLLATHEELHVNTPIVKEMLISNLLERPDLLVDLIRSEADLKEKAIYFRVAGEIRLEEAVPALMGLLSDAEDPAIIRLLITALGAIGDAAVTSALADYLYSDQRDLVLLAVRALGQVATPTAIHRLAERMGTDFELDKVILDIFSKVQDSTSLRKLNETIRSHNAHIRNIAKGALVRIGPKSVPLLTENLLFDDPDLRIHSLNVLGEVGDQSAVAPIRKLLNSLPKDPNVRFAAYEALGRLPLSHGAYALAGGLLDEQEHVRIAAARAIDRNFNDILKVGIKNMVKIRDEDAHEVVRTIINAQADTIFLGLTPEAYFQELALEHLAHAHKDIQQHLKNVLKRSGFDDFAAKIVLEEETPERGLKVCAVDDSRMILSIYKNTFHELGCESILFEFPAGAIEWFENEKADILFTDLNMPKITGVELTEQIRKKYSSEELPIIMVTTQNEAQDNSAAYKAGVDEILYKPFTAEILKKAIEKHV